MLKISVFATQSTMTQGVFLFERHVDWNPNLAYPYEETTKVLRALYGPKCIVQFTHITI